VDLALTQLSLRAHPLYRSVLRDYQLTIKALSEGKKEKEAAGTLARLATLRSRLRKDMQGVEDYLDWYEATQTEGESGAFRDYLDTAAELDRPPPPRRDALSRYLNLMEQEFHEDK
jgi:hypothetical protein